MRLRAGDGSVQISTNFQVPGATTYEWTFGTGGDLTLPNGAVLRNTANNSVAFGQGAGLNSQGANAIAIGADAGYYPQGTDAVAIGTSAGEGYQGVNAIAIGKFAGQTNQANNSIILNATGSALDQTTANTFTVAPIRTDSGNTAQALYYNTTTKEITYANVTAGSYSNVQVATYLPTYSGNISAGNISASGTSGKLGYTNGGFVQQITANSNGVSLNTVTGNIQLMGINLGVNGIHTVSFTNNKLEETDLILVSHHSGGVSDFAVGAYYAAPSTAIIWIRNITGADTSTVTPMLKFALIKAPGS
jgi:hypothetical protein